MNELPAHMPQTSWWKGGKWILLEWPYGYLPIRHRKLDTVLTLETVSFVSSNYYTRQHVWMHNDKTVDQDSIRWSWYWKKPSRQKRYTVQWQSANLTTNISLFYRLGYICQIYRELIQWEFQRVETRVNLWTTADRQTVAIHRQRDRQIYFTPVHVHGVIIIVG